MAWILPASIKAAFAQLNALFPKRSKLSDGTIGDAAHASRSSDHNPDDLPGVPDERDADSVSEVHAFDVTHDPDNGVDCNVLAERLRQRILAGIEKRVAYIIWNRKIFNPRISPTWRAYGGSNPHTKHMHVSILYTNAAEEDTSSWWGTAPPPPTPVPPPPKRSNAVVKNWVASLVAPNGGTWHLQADGGIITDDDGLGGPTAPYYGSVPGEKNGLPPGLVVLDLLPHRGGYKVMVQHPSNEISYYHYPPK